MELVIKSKKIKGLYLIDKYIARRAKEFVFEVEDEECEEIAYEISRRFGIQAFCR